MDCNGATRTLQVILPIHGSAEQPLPAGAITAMLLRVRGVRHAFVSPHTEMAWLSYDPTCFALTDAVAAIRALGCSTGLPETR